MRSLLLGNFITRLSREALCRTSFNYFIDDLSNVDIKGLNYQDCEVLFHVNQQSPDITGGVHVKKNEHHDGTGDKCMFQYASNETEDTTPPTDWITSRSGKTLGDARKNDDLRGVASVIDAEAQVATHSFERETDLDF